MVALRNDAIVNHQNCADNWIRAGPPYRFLRFL
jgi:hypothetical protein